MKSKKVKELLYTRKKIDKINKQIVNLLERRFVLTDSIGKIKKELRVPLEDVKREEYMKSQLPFGVHKAYTGEIFDFIVENSKIQQSRAKFQSIILTGMPISGKTSFGRDIAKELNIPFVDLDEAIGATEGMEVKDVILKKGENYFRKKERAMVRKLTGGYIIALGGGTVLNEKNVEYLKSIGKIVFIYRDIKELRKFIYKDRPLIKNRADLTKLYNERKELYEKVADYTVINNKTYDEVKNELVNLTVKILRNKS